MYKLGKKLLLDLFLGCLLIVVMYYFITGNFLHELFSTILIIGFFTHVIINRKYYLSILKNTREKKVSAKVKLGKWINIILLIAMIGMTITSIVISKDLFAFLNINVAHYKFWRIAHIVLAMIIVICAIIHLYLHKGMITGHLKKKFSHGEMKSNRIFAGLMIAFCLLLVIGSCKVIFGLSDGCNGNCKECKKESQLTHEEQITSNENPTENVTNENDSAEQNTPVEEEVSKPTLEEYLASLTCDGCHKNCSLLNPHCGTGRQKAEEATQRYYELYGHE